MREARSTGIAERIGDGLDPVRFGERMSANLDRRLEELLDELRGPPLGLAQIARVAKEVSDARIEIGESLTDEGATGGAH